MNKLYVTKKELIEEYRIQPKFLEDIFAYTDKLIEVLKDFGYNPKLSYTLEMFHEENDYNWCIIHPIIKDKGIYIDVLDARYEISIINKDDEGRWYWEKRIYTDEDSDEYEEVKQYDFMPIKDETTNLFNFKKLSTKECMKFLFQNGYLEYYAEEYEDEDEYVYEPHYVAFHPDCFLPRFPRIAINLDRNALGYLNNKNFNFFELKIIDK